MNSVKIFSNDKNHPVPEIEFAAYDKICISGPPLLEKRRGNFTFG
jgi:hypothetical protein